MFTFGGNALISILFYGFLMSFMAMIGIVFCGLKEQSIKKLVTLLVAFSAGALWGGAFFHMLPNALEESVSAQRVFINLTFGFVLFFILHQFIHWHHCHKIDCKHQIKPLGPMVLFADSLHNLLAGLGIGAVFLVDIKAGIAAWFAALMHEIPQEIGDFGLLIHSGYSRKEALFYNFLSALTFPLGGVIAYYFSTKIDTTFLISIAAGNFIYIAAADLTPEISRFENISKSILNLLFFLLGLVLLYITANTHHIH